MTDIDELRLLRAARPDVPPYPAGARHAARAELLAAAEGRARRLPRLPRSLMVSAGATAAAGLAVALTVVIAAPNGTGRHPYRAPAPPVNAAGLLYTAAEKVEARPGPHPRPRQWAYLKEIKYAGESGFFQIGPDTQTAPGRPATLEEWWRFDGRLGASRTPSGKVHVGRVDHDADETTPQQDYAYLASLPTDPHALIARICSGQNAARDLTNCVFPTVSKLLRNVAVPPRLHATLYRALALLPHIVIERNVVDLAGRSEIGVAYDRAWMREELLLDPHTYEYRGDRMVVTHRPPDPKIEFRAGQVLNATARLTARVVDRPGARS
jgi:hypothetical protein